MELVLELAAFSIKDNLGDYKAFNEVLVKNHTYQILKGLKHLHSFGIVHSNLKCSNILVQDTLIKLTDFGA